MILVAGCGKMGAPMLAALHAAGFDVSGFDVVPGRGDRITTDPANHYGQVQTLITVVRDIPQTDAVLFDVQRFAHAPNLKTIILCSTLSPRYVQTLRARVRAPVILIDAPMSGAQIAAREARLSFMLGGAASDIHVVQPLLDAMGSHFHHMGPFGSGMHAKVLNNLLAASNTAMTRLVLDWADASGLDETKLLDLIHTSSGQNWLASGFNDIEFARDGFAPDNTIGILVKDIASALDAAPPGADTALPDLIQTTIKTLKPRP